MSEYNCQSTESIFQIAIASSVSNGMCSISTHGIILSIPVQAHYSSSIKTDVIEEAAPLFCKSTGMPLSKYKYHMNKSILGMSNNITISGEEL